MKGWKDWLEVADKPKEDHSEDDTLRQIKTQVEAKLGFKLPDGAITAESPACVALTVDHNSSEEDIAKEIVSALKQMTNIVANDMATKYHKDKAKLKMMVAEEYYRQATSPATYVAKNFGDTKLVQ